MWRLTRAGLLLAMVACLGACGKISFGPPLGPEDAGLPDDAGDVVPDAGFVDTGVPPVDAGCIPITLPTEAPESWPFPSTAGGYQTVFWDWANEQSCNIGTCHGGTETPFIPVDMAAASSEYGRAISELWPSIRESQPLKTGEPPTGLLWRHHAMYEGTPEKPQENPRYVGAQISTINALIRAAQGCGILSHLTSLDGGPGSMCDEAEPDAGVALDAGDDGGSPDGAVDGGSPDAGPDTGVAPDTGVMPDSGAGGSGGLCLCDEIPDAGPIDAEHCVF